MNKENIKKYQSFKSEKFQKGHIYTSDNNKTFVLSLMAGQAIPPHQHPGYELQLTVIEGNGMVKVNEEEEIFQKGDILKCHADDHFSLRNTSANNLTCLAILFKVPIG